MSDTSLPVIVRFDTTANRMAFTPSPGVSEQLYIWLDSDDQPNAYYWDGAAWQVFNAGSGAGITQLTGDVTAGPGSGSQAATLANTAVTPGSYRQANVTIDSKGRITAATNGNWSLVNSWTFSTNVTSVPFTGLAGLTDIIIICRAITLSVSGRPAFAVSVDNGSNYFVASSDYVAVDAAGVESNAGTPLLNSTNATAARDGIAQMFGLNVTGAPRMITVPNRANMVLFVGDTANDVDAVEIFPNNGGNITGGSIYLFGR